MTAYYYNKYRHHTNWGAYHANKRSQLSYLFAGIDKDIESIFLNLDKNSLEHIFCQYGKEYGNNAERYARNTFPKWKQGVTKLSGQTAERLLNLLPPFLSQAKRYELVKKLREYYMNKRHSNQSVTTSQEHWKQDLLPVINTVVERSNNFALPEELKMRATWLAGGDAEGANKILTSVEQEEARLRTAYLDVEFKRIEHYVNIVENTQSVSHTIVLPQGKIHVTIQQKKKPFINRVFGGRKMGNDNRELVPREELERALMKQQSKGELLNLSFDDLTEKQKTALRERVLNEKFNLELSQQKADQRFANSTRDMANTIKAVNALEQASKSDYEVKSSFETASGSTNITVKKNNNTVIIVVAIVIGIIIFLFLKK
jgi:hypothetical protein